MAKNKFGAIGLMQFMPSTLADLGYTKTDIQNMTAIQQLDVVEEFFNKNNYYHKNESLSPALLYAIVLGPGKANCEVIYTEEDKCSLFRTKAREAYLIGKGKGPVEAYLNIPMPRRDDSHVFGPVIMALTEAEKLGIENVEIEMTPEYRSY